MRVLCYSAALSLKVAFRNVRKNQQALFDLAVSLTNTQIRVAQYNDLCRNSFSRNTIRTFESSHNKFIYNRKRLLIATMDHEDISCEASSDTLQRSFSDNYNLGELFKPVEVPVPVTENRKKITGSKPKPKESKKLKRKRKLEDKYLLEDEAEKLDAPRNTKKNQTEEFDTCTPKIIKKKQGKTLSDDEVDYKKKRPNYFVSVQVDSSDIHKSIKTVQDEIIAHNAILSKALIPVPTMHITIAVMHLANADDIVKASSALVHSYDQLCGDICKDPLHLTFSGLSHFNNQVLYVNISNEDGLNRLSQVAKVINNSLEEAGVEMEDKKGFQPHMTIMKLTKAPQLRKNGIKKILPKWYESNVEKHFGQQTVKSLQLLSMLEPKDEKGYYSCKKEVHFSSGHILTKKAEFQKEMINKTGDVKRSIRTATLSKLNEIAESSSSNENIPIVDVARSPREESSEQTAAVQSIITELLEHCQSVSFENPSESEIRSPPRSTSELSQPEHLNLEVPVVVCRNPNYSEQERLLGSHEDETHSNCCSKCCVM